MGSTSDLHSLECLRRATPADDDFMYAVFCSTYRTAGMPHQALVPHGLRLQHTVQEQRFEKAHPGFERYVVEQDGEPVGRATAERCLTAEPQPSAR